ncbi:MAG: hypothetical protein ACYTDT_09215 [Planctomycetota bacterium]|jgi:hypothetical protein
MIKTVAALIALVAGGFAGAVLTSESDAQRIIVEEEETVILKTGELVEPVRNRTTMQTIPMQFAQRAHWELREVNDWIMLFNPMSGETFYLDDNDDGVFWKPIHRQGAERFERVRREQNERATERRRERDPDARDRDLRRAEEDMERHEEAIDRLREALERAEEARNRARDEREDRDRDVERERDDDRRDVRNELKRHLEELEEEAHALKKKFEDADGKDLRRKIEKKMKQKLSELDKVRKKLKELR